MTVDQAVVSLAEYAVRKGLLGEDDRIWAINRLLEVLHLDSVDADAVPEPRRGSLGLPGSPAPPAQDKRRQEGLY